MDLMLLDTLRTKMVNGANFADAFELYFNEVADDRKILELSEPARHELVEMAIAERVHLNLRFAIHRHLFPLTVSLPIRKPMVRVNANQLRGTSAPSRS